MKIKPTLAVAATAALALLVPATAAQADPAPPTIAFTPPAGFTSTSSGGFPVLFCTVQEFTQLPYTVDGIKGNPHTQYTLGISATGGGLGGEAEGITKADNGVQEQAIWTGVVNNDTTVTFTATLYSPSPALGVQGPVVATSAPVSEYVSCG